METRSRLKVKNLSGFFGGASPDAIVKRDNALANWSEEERFRQDAN